jgi:metal transporter CNNM
MSGNLSGCPVCPLCAADEASTVLGSMPLDLLLTAFLLCLSGLFSGLTLGLMSLDVDDLKIIIDGGKDAVQSEEVGHALKVLTVREKGNLLLCTLLLGNTLVNALIAILSASFTSGIIGAFAATGFIVIFGEIMPQSFCSRYGLLIGAKTVWLVKIFIVLLYPVAWPISAVLDWVLGEEMRLTYTKQELVKLVELHEQNMESEITQADSSLLKGALKFSSIRVKDIMTERVMRGPGGYTQGIFMLDINGKLDFDTILEMYKRGHTRVPICDGDPMNPQNDIVGLILTKDLMLVDPDDTIETRTLLHYCGRQVQRPSPSYVAAVRTTCRSHRPSLPAPACVSLTR